MTVLKTARLVLRPPRVADLGDLHAIFSDPRAMTYWSTLPHTSRAQTADRLQAMMEAPAETSADFIVELDGRAIGKAGFWRLPEIGYILHPDAWGRGIATEALAAVLDHAFAAHDFRAALADVDPRNGGSIRVLEKLGFTEINRAARTWFIGGQWCDSVYLHLPRTVWGRR